MTLSDFCIKRPVFAAVLSLLIVVLGVASLLRLPVRELPDVDAAVVSVVTRPTPAPRPRIVDTEITELIEGAVAGIAGIKIDLLHEPRGGGRTVIEFAPGRDIDEAANDVRDAVARVRRDLPEEADEPRDHQERQRFRPGDADRDHQRPDERRPRSPTTRALHRRPAGDARRRRAGRDLRRAALRDPHLARPAGDGGAQPHGRRHRGRAPAQQRRAAGGRAQVDQPPVHRPHRQPARQGDAVRQHRGRAASTATRSGSPTSRASSSASRTTTRIVRSDGREAVGLGVLRQSQANTIAISNAVRRQLDLIRPTLPDGHGRSRSAPTMRSSSTSRSTRWCMALGIAVVLVVLVIFAFLASARATLVPAITIPVAVIGSFVGIYALGFSINVLTLLALILRSASWSTTRSWCSRTSSAGSSSASSPLVAGVLGTRQVTFAVIATSLTLIAVFVPISFLEGKVGRLFTEFGFVLGGGGRDLDASSRSALCPVLCTKAAAAGSRRSRRLAMRLLERGLGLATRGYRALLGARARCAGGRAAARAARQRRLVRALPRPAAGAGAERGSRRVLRAGDRAAGRHGRLHRPGRCARSRRSSSRCARAARRSRIFSMVGRGGDPHQRLRGRPARRLGRARAQPAGHRALADPRAVGEIAGARAFPSNPVGPRPARQPDSPLQVVIGGPDYDSVKQWSEAILRPRRGEPGPAQPRDRLRGEPAAARRADRSRQGRRSRHRRRDHRRDPADHARLARDHELRRPRPRVPGDRPGAARGPAHADRSRQHLRALRPRSGALAPLTALVTLEEGAAAPALRRYDRLPSITISAALADGYDLGSRDPLHAGGRDRDPAARGQRSASPASRSSSSRPRAGSRSPSRSRC